MLLKKELLKFIKFEYHKRVIRTKQNTSRKESQYSVSLRFVAQKSSKKALTPQRDCRRVLYTQIIVLYRKWMSTLEICETTKKIYDVFVSITFNSNVTRGIINEIILRPNRPLDAVYWVIFMYCFAIKSRDNQRVIFIAKGINLFDNKEL